MGSRCVRDDAWATRLCRQVLHIQKRLTDDDVNALDAVFASDAREHLPLRRPDGTVSALCRHALRRRPELRPHAPHVQQRRALRPSDVPALSRTGARPLCVVGFGPPVHRGRYVRKIRAWWAMSWCPLVPRRLSCTAKVDEICKSVLYVKKERESVFLICWKVRSTLPQIMLILWANLWCVAACRGRVSVYVAEELCQHFDSFVRLLRRGATALDPVSLRRWAVHASM